MELNRCSICDKYISSTKEGKIIHFKQYHAVTVQALPPVRYTPEQKRTIVERLEIKLGKDQFYDPFPAVRAKEVQSHEAECSCKVCFDVRLDKLVASSEAALQEMRPEPQVDAEINYIDPRY